MNRTRFLALFIFVLASLTAQGQWTLIPSGTTHNLVQVDFPDSFTGYILGKSTAATTTSELLKTVDGGITWNTVLNNHKMFCFDFLTVDTGVVISNDTIFKTYNGGLSWTSVPSNMGDSYHIHMNSLNEWFTIPAQGSGYTTDGGNTWLNGSTFGTIPLVPTDFQFINDSTVIGVGWYTTKSFISKDKGLHFIDLSYFTPLGSGVIYSVCYPSPIIGFATGNHRILKSTDGGITYTKIDSTLGFDINCLRYLDANNLYGVGYNGGIVKTSDGGINWSTEASPTTQKLNKIIFPNSHTAIAIGDGGTILMNANISTGINNVNPNENLVSVFPNPFNKEFTVQINSSHPLQFTLYNSLGEKRMDKILTNGINNINLSDCANNIYFYKMTSDKKLIKSGKIMKQ